MSTAPALYRKLAFNPLTDFEYIGQVADVPMTVIAKKGLPPESFKDFIPYMKQNRDKLNYGNAGLGAASHLCGLLLLRASVQDAVFKEVLAKLGSTPAPVDKVTPDGLSNHLKSEIARWGPIIKKAGIYAD